MRKYDIGERLMTLTPWDICDFHIRDAAKEIAELRKERDEWKLRYEAECEDHEASVRSLEQYYNRLED